MLQKFLTKIVDNVQIEVKNLHVRSVNRRNYSKCLSASPDSKTTHAIQGTPLLPGFPSRHSPLVLATGIGHRFSFILGGQLKSPFPP